MGRSPFRAFGIDSIPSGIPLLRVVIVLSMVWIPGCGDDGPNVGRVQGVVTLGGKPLPEATVFFQHQDGGRIARAVTDESGRYVLNFSLSKAGAIVGPNSVRISTLVEPLRDDAGRLVPGTGKEEIVPKKYNRESELVVEVKSGKNELNFDLEPG